MMQAGVSVFVLLPPSSGGSNICQKFLRTFLRSIAAVWKMIVIIGERDEEVIPAEIEKEQEFQLLPTAAQIDLLPGL